MSSSHNILYLKHNYFTSNDINQVLFFLRTPHLQHINFIDHFQTHITAVLNLSLG